MELVYCHRNSKKGLWNISTPNFGSVGPTVQLGLWNLRCAPLQWYRATLCTINLCCAPWCTRGASFFRSRGHPEVLKMQLCTDQMVHQKIFHVHVISHHLDGAQCEVVSLALYRRTLCWYTRFISMRWCVRQPWPFLGQWCTMQSCKSVSLSALQQSNYN